MANNLEIKLGLALQDLEKGVAQAKSQIKSLGKEKADVVIDIRRDRLSQDLAAVKAQLASLANQAATPDIEIQREQALNDIVAIRRQLKDLDDLSVEVDLDVAGADRLKNLIEEIKTGFGREIGAQIFQGLSQIPAAVAQTTLQFEKLQTVLKTTLGSQSEADKAFALIKEFAASTPFQVSSITDAFIKLTNRGIKTTRESLTSLGDLASSQGKELDQLVEAILDASTGENERLKEFGIQASKAGDQVTFTFKGVQKTVAATPEAINAAILGFGNLQGVAGGMEAQSKTLGGALSNLQDTADSLSVAFGEELTPILNEIVKGFSDGAAGGENFAKGAGQNVAAAIKFIADNGEKLKLVIDVLVLRFALLKAEAALAAIATTAAGAAAGGSVAAFAALAGAVALATGKLLILAGLVKGIEFAKFANDLAAYNRESEVAFAGSTQAGNDAIRIATKLKNLNDERRKGVAISEEQRKGFLKLADAELQAQRQRLAAVEALKPADEAQKQSQAAEIFGIKASIRAIEGQKAELEKVVDAKKESAKASKEEIKAAQDAAKEQAKIAKQKADIDEAAAKKRADLLKGEAQDNQLSALTAKREDALQSLKIKQEQELADLKLRQEQEIGDRKISFEKEIADLKDAKEKALEDRKLAFEKNVQAAQEAFQARQQSQESAFQAGQQAKAEAFQKQQQEARKTFEESLSGARGLLDREGAIATADSPEAAAKLKAQFAEEDRIRQQILSTNVDTRGSKEQFAQQAKQIAGVQNIQSQEDLARVQFALAELEAKAKAQFAEEERAKEAEFEAQKQSAEKTFKEAQNANQKLFEANIAQDKLNFERNVLSPQKKAIEDEISAKKVEFERGTLQPLKLQQEAELQALKKSQDEQEQTTKLGFEQQIADLKKQFKLEEISLDAEAQKARLDKEAAFKEQQRNLDLQVAEKIGKILSAASINKLGIGAALGSSQIPKFSKGVENFGGGLAYVHAGEMLMNLSKGTSVIPANQVSRAMSNNSKNYSISINSAKDPNALLSEALQQIAVNDLRRSGL